MKFLTTTFYLVLFLVWRTFGQSTTPSTYTALQAQLENQPDSVRIQRLADFIRARVEQGDFPETTSANQAMLSIAKQTDNKLFLAQYYRSAAYIAQSEGNLTLAVVQFQRAVAIYRKIGDWSRLTTMLDRISWIYIEVRNLSLAESYCMEGLAIAQKHNLKENIVNLYANLATVYDLRKEYKKALWYNTQCIKIAQSITTEYSGALLNQGIFLKNAGQYAASISAYQRALRWAETHQYGYMKEMVYINLPNTLLLLNRTDEAEYYSQLALKSVRQYPNQQVLLREIYETLTAIYEKKGQFRQALDYHKQWVIHRDSVFNAEKSRQLVEAETRFQTREKQQKIQRLDEDNLRQQRQLRGLIGGVSLLVLLISILAWQYRALRRANGLVGQALNELKRTQDQLIQKEKMASLGELTAGIAHEIQNPLNFVNNFAEVSVDLTQELQEELDKTNLPADDKTYLAEILSDLISNQRKINLHGQRASNIVKGMLEHSRTHSGDPQATNLNALAEEYLRLTYQGWLTKHKQGSSGTVPASGFKQDQFNIQLRTDFDPHLGKVSVIPQDIGRVLHNLYNNAFYAVHAHQQSATADYEPVVQVSTKGQGNRVEICVIDNGIGIPDSVKSKIFQPFFTTKPTGEGTGLGLSLSYDIVTKGHGGLLLVKSEVGKGTEFIIELPKGNKFVES